MEERDTEELLCISADDKIYAFEFPYVAEISKGMNISKIPALPEYFAGVCNNRGEIIPIIRTPGEMMETGSFDEGGPIMLIIKYKNYKFGIILDKEPFIASSDKLSRVKTNLEEPEDCIWVEKEIWKSDKGIISLIDVKRMTERLIVFR